MSAGLVPGPPERRGWVTHLARIGISRAQKACNASATSRPLPAKAIGCRQAPSLGLCPWRVPVCRAPHGPAVCHVVGEDRLVVPDADALVCIDALQLVPDAGGLLREAARILRPGGRR